MKNVKIATINCGIKYKNRDDLLLIYFDELANVAAVFTQSSMRAAPVLWCQKNIKNGNAKALLVNAGNANCFTGKSGFNNVEKKVELLAKELNCSKEEIFICSTGVIGEKLPVEKITAKIPQLIKSADFKKDSWEIAAKSIMTTDTQHKLAYRSCKIGDQNVELVGFAKGAGMIAPNMATLLAFIVTDANITSEALSEILKEITEKTFNSITIDSDQSTNDSLFIFATKTAQNSQISDIKDPALADFKAKLFDLCLDLAKKIVLDGEGVKKIIKIQVNGAFNYNSAKEIAMAIGNSPLVKSAIAAADPNWGRIIMAIGKSCPLAKQELINLRIGNHDIIINGEIAKNYIEKEVHEYLKNEEILINVNLNIGNAAATIYSSDLNEEYVTINKDYRS